MGVGAGISLSLTPVVTPAAWDSISTVVEGRPSEGLTNEIGDRYLLISSTPFLRSYWRRCSCKIREKTQFPSKNPGTYGSVLHASVCCCFVPKGPWPIQGRAIPLVVLSFPAHTQKIITNVLQATVHSVVSHSHLGSQLLLGSCCPE